MLKLLLAIIAVSLTACGGGGGGGSSSTVIRTTSTPIPVFSTSYENSKEIGATTVTMPGDTRWNTTVAVADFDRTGNLDLFTASLTYNPATTTPLTATPSVFKFYKKMSDGRYIEDTSKLTSGAGCIHPRKAIVADFNGDGRPDVYVACHGYDATPYPGEASRVVLSTGNGTYTIQNAASDVGFWHSATAFDVDGDGDVDVVASNNFDNAKMVTFLNDGRGNFTREAGNRFPNLSGSYFSIEAVKVDGDNIPDIIIGGHEWSDNGSQAAPTLIITGNANNSWTGSTQTTITAVQNEGVVLDFVVTGSGDTKSIWVLRTSGGDGTFYQSVTIQRYDVATATSTVVYSQRTGTWTPWIISIANTIRTFVSTNNLTINQ
jgi:hypothetical protein